MANASAVASAEAAAMEVGVRCEQAEAAAVAAIKSSEGAEGRAAEMEKELEKVPRF